MNWNYAFRFKNKETIKEREIRKNLLSLELHGLASIDKIADNDIFLVGFPKSGNTLLMHIIAHLVYGLRKDCSKRLINTIVTDIYSVPFYFRLDKRHFFKSHELPQKTYKNVIYIVRDGRDAVISYYHMLKNIGKDVDLQEMLSSGGKCFVGTWNEHALKWLKNGHNYRILYIKYEDLILNKENEIVKIIDFLNLDRTSNDIQNVIEATTKENMLKMEQSYSWKEKKKNKGWKENTFFVRKGEAKGYQEIDPLLIKRFEEVSFEGLKAFGYL